MTHKEINDLAACIKQALNVCTTDLQQQGVLIATAHISTVCYMNNPEYDATEFYKAAGVHNVERPQRVYDAEFELIECCDTNPNEFGCCRDAKTLKGGY